jgi:MarR family transcriptional regulator for hemolysin
VSAGDETGATGKPEGLKRRAGIKLTIVARQIGRDFDQTVETTGLSRAKFGVIAITARHPGASQRTIAEYLEVTEVTAGRLIERLCADGYLERRPDPVDRRARRIHLTEKTGPLLERVAIIAEEHESRVFAGFDEAEAATFASFLDRISNNLTTMRGAAPAAENETKPAKARPNKMERAGS